MVADGARLKDAATEIAENSGLGKRDLYEAALAARGAGKPKSVPEGFDALPPLG